MNLDYTDIDKLNERQKKGEEIYIIPDDHKESAAIKTIAVMYNIVRRYDDTYYTYYYNLKGKLYKFGWEAPYDQIHRAYSKNIQNEWYDNIKPADKFGIYIDKNNPQYHFIADKPFSAMNKGVYYFGFE